jgi:hypothetical protein
VLKVDGGSGTLFEVTDNLSGSLFSVNTIAGFPILEVFSNNRMVAGAYGTNALVVSASSVGIGIATPSAKLHIQGNVSGSQFTSSRRNAIGFLGTASYARRALTASYALNASGGGGGSTLRTGSTYPITASKTSAIGAGTTNRFVKYNNASAVGQTFTPIFESGSAFIGIGAISSSLVSRLQVYRSGSNASVLKVDGGSGTLFEVTDNLSGSLFSVNTIAGFPILEVFSNNRIVAGAYGTNALVVSGSSVGIGIATPSAKLHIYNGNEYIQGTQGSSAAVNYSSFNRLIFNNDFSDTARGPNKITIYDDGAFIAGLSVHNNAVGYYSGNNHIWYKSTSPTVFTEVMRLSGSGNLGIGTTNPVQKLHISSSATGTSIKSEGGLQMTGSITVRGGLGLSNTSNYRLAKRLIFNNDFNDTVRGPNKITIYDDGAFIAGLSVNDGAVGYYSGNRHIWYKSTSPTVFTEVMRLSGSGNLGIGTTNPAVKLHVQGNISGSQFTSSRRNAVGFFGTSSYSRRALTASYVLGGAAGSSGTSGASGTSGSSGTSGTSGTSGSSGTSGVGSPGSSGTSGTSSTPALSLAQTFVLTASVSQLKLTQSAANNDQILVILDGLVQSRINSYTVSGSTLTLTENAPSGSNVDIRYLGGGSSVSSSFSRRSLTASYLLPASNNTTKAIFGYGLTSINVSITNLVSNTGVVANDTTGVGTARYQLAAAGYGGDKAIFGYGITSVAVSMTNLVSNTGVVATDTTGVGTARVALAASGYGNDKAIFGYGYTSVVVSMTNLVSNTGVVATDTTGVGTARTNLAAAGYGTDKAIFGFGWNGSTYYSITNLVSNTGVVATDTTGVGTARYSPAAARYGGDKAIFGYGSTGTVVSMVNLVSNVGVVANDTLGVGTARRYIAAAGYSTT